MNTEITKNYDELLGDLGYFTLRVSLKVSEGEANPADAQNLRLEIEEVWMSHKKVIVKSCFKPAILLDERDELLSGFNLVYDAAADRLMKAQEAAAS